MPELDYASAILLGIVQGLTEFLPVSSSGHLALFEHLGLVNINPDVTPLAFDLLLHLATVIVVLRSFYSTIIRIIKEEKIILLYLIAATIPAALCGFFFREYISQLKNSPFAVCAALICTSISLYVCEKVNVSNNEMKDLTFRKSLLIGIYQAFALVPGISRSGLTITGGVVNGLSRSESVTFSFILMIPIVTGAFTVEILSNSAAFTAIPAGPAAAGFFTAFITGIASLKILKLAVMRFKLKYFSAYCAVIGISGLLYFLIK